MKNSFLFCSVLLVLLSCQISTNGNPDRFKQGFFEIPAGDGYSKTIVIRKDSLQIEQYTKKVTVSENNTVIEKEIPRIDTLFITWKNNFAYTLQMKNPKTELDKEPIFVQITKVKDSSYEFSSRIGYSNFTPKGKVYISKKQQ